MAEREFNIVGLRQDRSRAIAATDVDTEGRRVKLSFASEKPVERWSWDGPYDEVLRMTPETVDLDRMNDGGALLHEHDRVQIGVIEKAWVGDDRRAYAIVRFSEDNPLAIQEFNDVVKGIRRNISFGYIIHEMEITRGDKSKKDTVTSINTEVLEISLVSVPADKSIGIGRSRIEENIKKEAEEQEKREVTMADDKQGGNEFAREDAILGFAKRFNVAEAVAQSFAADESKTVDDLRNYVKDNLLALSAGTEQTTAAPSANLDLSKKDSERYSLCRSIMSLIDPQAADKAGFERECHEALVGRGFNTRSGGILVPSNIPYRGSRAELTATGGLTTGGALVGTEHMPEAFIDLLRNNMKMRELGMTILSGLTGNISIPRQDSAGSVFWVSEGIAPPESNMTFGQLQLSPKTVGAREVFSRQLLIQSAPSVDGIVQRDLAQIMARGIDLAAINGSGAANQPLGLLNTTGVEEISQIGLGFAWADAVAFKTALKADNALLGTPKWLTNAAVEGSLASIEKATNTGIYLLSDSNKLNGFEVHTSEQVPAATLIFGDFSQVIMGEWGVIEIVANDKGTTFSSGSVEVRTLHMVDIQVRYPQALKKLTAFAE